ncbi:unnamed protein product, partial [Adineta ricciae]
GRFCFIPPSTKVDTYVGQQLEKALQSSITNLEIKWNLPIQVTTAPKTLPPVYANDRLIVYGFINDPSVQFDHRIQIELFSNQHKLAEAKITQIPAIIQNQTISRLAAKALILELQHSKLPPIQRKGSGQARFQELNKQDEKSIVNEKEEQKKHIIGLSLKYHILSPYTSFVGIEKRRDGNNVGMVLREVPIEISADDQHLQVRRSAAQSFGMPRTMCCRDAAFSVRRERPARQIPMDVDNEEFPSGDEDIVRYLIEKQNFDGLWSVDCDIIQKLTGKSLTQFQYSAQKELIISAIIIILLETRFSSYSSMCSGIIQKSKKRILDLLNKDQNQFQSLFDGIRQQL